MSFDFTPYGYKYTLSKMSPIIKQITLLSPVISISKYNLVTEKASYEFEKKLGTGSFGTTYKAVSNNQSFAIKKIKLQDMLEESPNDIFLNYALAMEYKGLSQFNKTIEQFNKVLLLDENHVPTLYQLGVLLSDSNENDKAILILEKGLEIAKQQKDHKTANEFRTLIDEILY